MEEPDKDSGVEKEEFKARSLGAAKTKAELGITISDTPISSDQEPGTNKLDSSQVFRHKAKHKPRLHLVLLLGLDLVQPVLVLASLRVFTTMI